MPVPQCFSLTKNSGRAHYVKKALFGAVLAAVDMPVAVNPATAVINGKAGPIG